MVDSVSELSASWKTNFILCILVFSVRRRKQIIKMSYSLQATDNNAMDKVCQSLPRLNKVCY